MTKSEDIRTLMRLKNSALGLMLTKEHVGR
ncbi:hypothetical protein ACVWY0_003596 [Arthrobacter sp. UYNi723]